MRVGKQTDALGHGRLEEAAVRGVGEAVSREGITIVEEGCLEAMRLVSVCEYFIDDDLLRHTGSGRRYHSFQVTSAYCWGSSGRRKATRPTSSDRQDWNAFQPGKIRVG